jgi:hypothetical protein
MKLFDLAILVLSLLDLATSKTSRIINHTNEPEPPMLKPI